MADIIIFGIGDIAELAHYYFTNDSDHKVVGFTVDSTYRNKEKFCGLPVLDFENVEKKFKPNLCMMFVAISYARMNNVRTEKVKQAKKKGYKLANYISSRATILTDLVNIENCFILENNTLQPFVKIGNNVTLWSGNHIGHHSKIDDNTFISSHVVISGRVHVGKNCFMGVNSTTFDHISISDYTLVSAGSLVSRDTDKYGVYKGSPAKKINDQSCDMEI
jgi:sugar O-acyltransferase (sialic acid O-acetyltransferase NeuD family)